jgi:outer membrane murein-binding lipoprotein Lpp
MAVGVVARRRGPTWAAAVLALAGCVSVEAHREQDPSAATLADRLSAYLADLEQKLSALVAEERFEQSVTAYNEHGVAQAQARRVLVSEIGFVRLPEDQAWLGHRRVRSINGRPVRATAPLLEGLFTRTGPEQLAVARQIADENSRHNLGHPRSTNVPTLPLDLLHPRHRSAYAVSLSDIDRRQGQGVARMVFTERAPGSVVAYDQHRFVRTTVTAWVEIGTGAVQRAAVTLIPPVTARENHAVRVEFELDPKLGVRVPVRLTESFWAGGLGAGKATYRNYRRFETAARVVPPPP